MNELDDEKLAQQTAQEQAPEAAENPAVEEKAPEAQSEPAAEAPVDEVAELKAALEKCEAALIERETALIERTEDLQRLQAEYVNYKKRVDRDRPLARQSGVEAVLRDMMPAFDSIVAAENMGELSEGFKLTADEFIKVARQYGMVKVGEVGEEFDPLIHEALMQQPVAGSGEPTINEVMQVGYQINGQTVRPARVVVAMPTGEEEKTEESKDSE